MLVAGAVAWEDTARLADWSGPGTDPDAVADQLAAAVGRRARAWITLLATLAEIGAPATPLTFESTLPPEAKDRSTEACEAFNNIVADDDLGAAGAILFAGAACGESVDPAPTNPIGSVARGLAFFIGWLAGGGQLLDDPGAVVVWSDDAVVAGGSIVEAAKVVAQRMSDDKVEYSQVKRQQDGFSDCSKFVQLALDGAGVPGFRWSADPGQNWNTFRFLHDPRFRTIQRFGDVQPGDVLVAVGQEGDERRNHVGLAASGVSSKGVVTGINFDTGGPTTHGYWEASGYGKQPPDRPVTVRRLAAKRAPPPPGSRPRRRFGSTGTCSSRSPGARSSVCSGPSTLATRPSSASPWTWSTSAAGCQRPGSWATEHPVRPGLDTAALALVFHAQDDGRTWTYAALATLAPGQSFRSSAGAYTDISWNDPKCNIFVAEVLFSAFGLVMKQHSDGQSPERWFPPWAADWHNRGLALQGQDKSTGQAVCDFVVVDSPQLGDLARHRHRR